MSSIENLSKDLDIAYNEFKLNYAPHANSFPSVDEFQRKMIGKGYLLYQTSDYLSSIIYLSLALWSYAIKPRSEESVNSLKKFIADARQKLKSSLTSAENSDTPSYTYESEDDMRDRLTGKKISFSTMSGAYREKKMVMSKFIYPNLYKHLYLSDSNNVLMYGPPGTGKTLLAKASVGELNRQANGSVKFLFYSVAASDIRSKWEGGTEKNIAAMFQTASHQAKIEEEKINRSASKKIKVKSVLFLDEVESIAQSRDKGGDNRALTTLLQKMDGMKSEDNVVIMAATNIPWDLDTAFVRRFSASVFVDLPDFLTRVELLLNTFIDKYEKHNDVRRLLSFAVVHDNSVLERKINSYSFSGPSSSSSGSSDIITDNIIRNIKSMYESTGDKNGYTDPVDQYVIYAMYKIQNIVSQTSIKVNWKDWYKLRFPMFKLFVKFLFHLSDLMGPSSKVISELKMEGYGKRSISKSKTKYGYSASDITKIVSEFFSITAEKIIESTFKSEIGEMCDDSYLNERKTNCYVKLMENDILEHSKNGLFILIDDAKNKDFRFVSNENGQYQDRYTVFIPSLFMDAINRYPSTTGNLDMYCNYIEYEITGTTPNLKEKCQSIKLD